MEEVIARGIQLLIALGGAYLLALWFALVVWTFQDIQARSRSVIAQIFSTLVVVLFFVPGVLIYLILRPQNTLDDALQRSLEEEYMLQDLQELPLCPSCQHYVEADFVYCPNCRTSLRQDCVSCGRLIDVRWEVCPYCGEEQYPEDERAYAIEEWEPAEREGVSRLITHARGRLAPHRSRTQTTESLPAETSAPLLRGDLDERGALDWEEDDALPGESWRRSGESATLNGNGNGHVHLHDEDEWDDVDDDDLRDVFDQTEELPTDVLRPPR
jgi:RNA polymerase subunit RPABC4/transcription elongation factor Spt4